MDSLEYPDLIYFRAAQGWLELGNSVEALDELGQVSAASREHPDILELRWHIAVKGRAWEQALALAEALCCRDPDNASGWIHRSYCLHEIKRTQEAWDTLLPMADAFPCEWLICYNLACYACQLGRLEDGRHWLTRAAELGDPMGINRLAASDPDLTPLFPRQAR